MKMLRTRKFFQWLYFKVNGKGLPFKHNMIFFSQLISPHAGTKNNSWKISSLLVMKCKVLFIFFKTSQLYIPFPPNLSARLIFETHTFSPFQRPNGKFLSLWWTEENFPLAFRTSRQKNQCFWWWKLPLKVITLRNSGVSPHWYLTLGHNSRAASSSEPYQKSCSFSTLTEVKCWKPLQQPLWHWCYPSPCHPFLEWGSTSASVSRRLQKLSISTALLFHLAPNLTLQMINQLKRYKWR